MPILSFIKGTFIPFPSFIKETFTLFLSFIKEIVEVDFCLFENRQAIQVSYSISDPDTKEREVKALVAYHKRYPESRLMIITMDEETDIQIDDITIEVIPIWKWMLKE